jgi:hypothetical protein
MRNLSETIAKRSKRTINIARFTKAQGDLTDTIVISDALFLHPPARMRRASGCILRTLSMHSAQPFEPMMPEILEVNKANDHL